MNVSQRIPNLLSGISQQPDNRKRPGQVKDAKNVFPDYALGMLKRPGGEFVAQLYQADADSGNKWFSILRDDTEKYVAQYADNRFQIWSLIDGYPRAVDMGNNTGKPGTCNITTLTQESDDIRSSLLGATGLIQERTDLHTFAGLVAKRTDGLEATYTRLFNVKNTYRYDGSIDSDLQDGITQDENGLYTLTEGGNIVHHKVTAINTTDTPPYKIGSELTAEYPLIAQRGLRVFEIFKKVNAANSEADLEDAEDDYNDTDTNTGALVDFNTAQTAFDTALTTDWANAHDNCIIGNDDVPADRVTVTTAGTGFSNGTTENVAQSNTPASGVTGGVFNVTVVDTEVDSVTIVNDPGFHEGDIIELTGFAGAQVTFNRGAYLSGATGKDIKVLTINDTTYVVNTKKKVRMLNDESPNSFPRAACEIKVASFSTRYEVRITQGTSGTITGVLDIGTTVSGNVLSPGYIAGALGTDFNNKAAVHASKIDLGGGTFVGAIQANAYGNTIVFTNHAQNSSTDKITIEVRGGAGENAIFGFAETIAQSVDLPESCLHDYVVKVVNSSDVDVDDMYVKFEAENNVSGYGVWAETLAPNIDFKFDPLTLPHKLERQPNGSFVYGPVTWDDRVVGDDKTNPKPSFIGATITGIVFHRNRLGLLSADNVVFSRASDIQNFWATSALTGTASDPIDISTSSSQPCILTHGIPTSIGLVLYSNTEQFLLTTDADVFSPEATNIKTLATYDAADDITPVSMGTTQGFVSKTPLYSKFFELLDINIEQPPVMNDTTVSNPELLPRSLDVIAASSDLSLVAFSTKGERDVFMFRFLNEGRDQRTIQTWFKWQLTGTMLDHFFDGSSYYAVTSNGSEVVVQKFDVSQSSDSGFLTLPTGEKTDVCLDLFHVNPHRTYDSSTDKTTITLPYDHVDGNGDFTVVALGGYIDEEITAASSATVGKVISEDHDADTPIVVTHTANPFGDTFVIDGDYRGLNLIIGYQYDMEIKLPRLYLYEQNEANVKYDSNADLIIHRLKVDTGLSGPVMYSINIQGKEDFDQTIEVVLPYLYDLNSVAMQRSATHEVPIYQRNENLSLSIKSTGPFPVSLLGYDWEGRYNSRFYRRR